MSPSPTSSSTSKDAAMEDTNKPPVIQHGILKERRFKLSRACDRCRRRRIRCDEGHPCQSCISSNAACTFDEPGKRSHPHKSKKAATLEDRMHHLESLISSIPSNVFATAGNENGNVNGYEQHHEPVHPATLQPANGHESLNHPAIHIPFRSGVPPPSLGTNPLVNPFTLCPIDQLTESTSRLSCAPSYFYFDDEGSTRWQGETSGLPLLDLLVERERPVEPNESPNTPIKNEPDSKNDWFPDRVPRKVEPKPHTLWKAITAQIAPKLMDSLVQCFLSTTYYMMPFLHLPTFLADYGDPRKWGEPGFACFVLSVCALSSRHIDDPRVRKDVSDTLTAGLGYFELFNSIRSSTVERPTMYAIQGVFVAAVYSIGLGKLSKGLALLAEATTLSIDAGIHRSVDVYDLFDPIEDEVRKRTFFCVYSWDKQASAAFGRPPMIRLRDADVPEPALIDDEYITKERLGPQPPGIESRMTAFVYTNRLFTVLEGVLDAPPSQNPVSSPFRSRCASVLSGFRRHNDLREEEALLDEIIQELPEYWKDGLETANSEDVVRITQSRRIHTLELFIRMLIQRHRFSEYVTKRSESEIELDHPEGENEAMLSCHACAVKIVELHMDTAARCFMTYYGVHVIHQLTQAGRTLVAVLLNCKTEDLKPLVLSSLEALTSCVGLLRRFSSRYVCGLRSGDLIEEFCRCERLAFLSPVMKSYRTPKVTGIPLEAPRAQFNGSRPAWHRPVPKKHRNSVSKSHHSGESANGDDSSPSPSILEATLVASSPKYGPMHLSSEPSFTAFSPSSLNDPVLSNSYSINPILPNTGLSANDFMAMLGDSNGFDVTSLYNSDFTELDLTSPTLSTVPEMTSPFPNGIST